MTFSLNQQRREFLYSVLLIILIPAAIIAGTVWLTNRVQDNFDLELRRKANLANEVFGVQAAAALATNQAAQASATIQSLIDRTLPQAPEINLLSVSTETGQIITTIASSDHSQIGSTTSSEITKLAFAKQLPVAALVAVGEANSRNWQVASPITGPDGQLLGVTTMRVSLRASDQVMTATLRDAFLILAFILLGIVLLLIHHFRFVEYAELFRKQTELDQMKDDFISIATHELRAPMGIIKSYISMASDEKVSDAAKGFLNTAFEQTERLNHLVTDLLNVSRLEQGRTSYNIVNLDLAAVINPLVESFGIKAKEKQLQLKYQTDPSLSPVLADRDRLSEVMTNLIDNSIKYSKSGTITISHRHSPTGITTIVADTGIGMTEAEQARLFQRFYRARNQETADIPGTGLGLWIIKQYVEHMGGSIVVESQPGQGTKFFVTLPPGASSLNQSPKP